MIDTINMTGCYFINDRDIYKTKWTKESSYFMASGQFGQAFQYIRKGESLKLWYDAGKRSLRVEVSIPKFLYGNNVQMVTAKDLRMFLYRLDDYLRSRHGAYPTYAPDYWQINRMDVCWNFHVEGAVPDYIKAYSNIHLSKYTTRTYGGFETVEWKNKSVRMSFYDKEKEVRKRRNDENIIKLAEGIIRFEVRCNYKTLKKYSRYRLAGHLLDESVAKELLRYYIERIGINKPFQVSNCDELSRKLIQAYGHSKAEQLLGFILNKHIYGADYINRPTASTYKRRINELDKIGIAPILSEKGLLPLDISSLTA